MEEESPAVVVERIHRENWQMLQIGVEVTLLPNNSYRQLFGSLVRFAFLNMVVKLSTVWNNTLAVPSLPISKRLLSEVSANTNRES